MSFDRQEFVTLYNQIAERFPAMRPVAVVASVLRIVETLPMRGVREICLDFFENAKNTPLPGDFRKAAVTWLKANKVYQHDDGPMPIDCRVCGDLGIIRIRHHENSNFDELMKCSCGSSIAGNFRAPTWDQGLSSAFKKESCPLEWFKPTEAVDVLAFRSDKTILQIIEKWKERKTKSETYWKVRGY